MKSVVLWGSILLLSACGSMQSQVVKKNVSSIRAVRHKSARMVHTVRI